MTIIQQNLYRACGVLTVVIDIQPDPGIVEVSVDYAPLVGCPIAVGNAIKLPAINRKLIRFFATSGDRK